MNRHLSLQEQETIIVFNGCDKEAAIFTYDRSWQRRLEGKLGLKPIMDNGFGGKEYEISKKRIRPPLAPRKMSAEAKKKLQQRARKMHQNGIFKPKTLIPTTKSAAIKNNIGYKRGGKQNTK